VVERREVRARKYEHDPEKMRGGKKIVKDRASRIRVSIARFLALKI
jgi:hypothetical protein